MDKRRTLRESLTDKSYVMGMYNKMSESEKISWKKAIKECLEENPKLKSNVNFYKFLTGFGIILLIVAFATGGYALAALPALGAYSISMDKYTFNELRKCVRKKKGLDVEEDLPSTDDQPAEFIDESKRKKVIRMTESDLVRLVKRVINEQEDVLGNIKDLLNNNGVDTSDMDDEEVLYELTSLMRTTNNKRLKHELTKLYYDFTTHHKIPHGDVQDFPEPESRKMKRRSVPNPRFYSDYDDDDENLDFLSDIGISRPKY